jgi:hypothetical protein
MVCYPGMLELIFSYKIGIRDFLMKPLQMEEMAFTIRKVLDEV